ncbi:hypothetical protein Tco_0544379, partial [Tanacetum coccineum]
MEDDLKKTKQTYSFAFTKLILRIKKLESKVKTGKARKRARVVLSEDEVESPVVVETKTIVPSIPKVDIVRPKQQEKPVRKTV